MTVSPARAVNVVRYEDAQSFLAATRTFLMKHEVENGLLGVAMRVANDPVNDTPQYFAVVRADGEIIGAALSAVANRLMITRIHGPDAVSALAQDVLAAGVPVHGMAGPEPSIGELAFELAAHVGRKARRQLRTRLLELRRVQLPEPMAPGRLRQATELDLPLAIQWVAEFEAAIGESGGDSEALARARIASGALFIWQDDAPVSMAARARQTPNGVSINLVYTPRALRGRGYASACVGALSQALLDQGNRFVCLFAEVDNKTSNGIYERLGYRYVSDSGQYALEEDSDASTAL